MSTITIRPGTRADIGPLDAVLARSYPRLLAADYPPSVLVTAIPIIARARPELVTSGTYFVADFEGAVVAGGGWTPTDPPGSGQLRHFVTDLHHLRRGIGRAVLEFALQDATAAGIVTMRCLSTRTAVPFYAALGFEAAGEQTILLAPGITFPAVAMMRRL